MKYEIRRLSSGWLVTIPGKEENTIACKFTNEIAEVLFHILTHATDNPPPYGSGAYDAPRSDSNAHSSAV